MITIATNAGPTVQYEKDISQAVVAYAAEHLQGYHVHAQIDADAPFGVCFEAIPISGQTDNRTKKLTVH
ncbi:MAG: hypothetical protein CMK74_04125 [Pseudomonadales bacterium]|nr:hypothetical protein [Pseudomonadales bacterium]